MLQSLSVQDYALIKELEMEFESGLNIITGATGAGKSILIGALRMILGERANTDVVREGTSKAVVEGIFDDADTERIRAVLRENEIPTDPLPRVILRRRITERGSRGFVNDTPATLDVMRAVAGESARRWPPASGSCGSRRSCTSFRSRRLTPSTPSPARRTSCGPSSACSKTPSTSTPPRRSCTSASSRAKTRCTISS